MKYKQPSAMTWREVERELLDLRERVRQLSFFAGQVVAAAHAADDDASAPDLHAAIEELGQLL